MFFVLVFLACLKELTICSLTICSFKWNYLLKSPYVFPMKIFDIGKYDTDYTYLYDILPGWVGVLCDRPCDDKSYGKDCEGKCKCFNNAACNPQNGKIIE